MWRTSTLALLASTALFPSAWADNVLSTDGFQNCGGDSSIKVDKVDISFSQGSNEVTFDVAGSSDREQEVTASLVVEAYGIKVFEQDFDPCDESTKVDQLCPVPARDFSVKDSLQVPSEYAGKIPSIAFSIPDLDGSAKLILKSKDGDNELACIESGFTNGKTVELPAVSWVAAGIAAGALVLSAVGAAASGASPGSSSPSPGFFEVITTFQGFAMNGMHSVQYPKIYSSFSNNFAFSTGLISWEGLQKSIDSFRSKTGGNLDDANYDFVHNASESSSSSIIKRGLLYARADSSNEDFTDGISRYVEQYSVPEENTFMTVLLVFAIIVAAVVVGILLFKVILEAWSLWGTFPKGLTTFRKEYWRVMGQTIVNLILLLYGVWVLYCIFQFTNGDSWAAKILAGVILAGFTGILAFYVWKITSVVRKLRKLDGDAHALYTDKPTWKKYRIFYENYKTGYWWLFIPFIVYMFAKGCILAGGNGHGLIQSAGQLIVEALMLILLLWNRPYNRKSGNWINIIIQVVRVLSVICVLVFVQELGVSQTTSTITGVVLVVVQSVLTAALAILILVNSIITCCKENPHRKKRKEAEKLANRDMEGDAFLMQPQPYNGSTKGHKKQMSQPDAGYEPMRAEALDRARGRDMSQDRGGLMSDAASMGKGGYHQANRSESSVREPTLPHFSMSGNGQQPQPYRDNFNYNNPPNYRY